MRGRDGFGRLGRYREFIWIPRGPLGIAVFLVAVLVVLGLAIAVSALLLAVAIAAGLALGAYQVGGRLLSGARERLDERLAGNGRRPLVEGERPLERYLADVEEFDHLTTETVRIEPEAADAWWTQRRLGRLAARAAVLRESAIAVERAVSRDRSAEAARPGLWELIVAATELQRYLHDLLDFPSSRGRAAQQRELHSLHERRDELTRRRDALVRRLGETDLRSTG